MALIIDTDIGTDIDDALALAYAIKSGIDIKLITTVHGPTEYRATLARKIGKDLGVELDVVPGEKVPIKQQHIFLSGLEDNIYATPTERFDSTRTAPRALAEIIEQNPGIDIAAIGPLTNIGRAFQQYPALPEKIGTIYVMGNAYTTDRQYFLNFRAHNLKVDPEAADIVFSANVQKVLIPTDVCKKHWITKEQLTAIKGNNAYDYIRTAGLEWLNHIQYNDAFLYDPLIIEQTINQDTTARKTYGNVKIAYDSKPGFSDQLLSRLLNK